MPGKRHAAAKRIQKAFRRRKAKKSKHASLTVSQKAALKKIIGEDITVFDVNKVYTALNTTMTRIDVGSTGYEGSFFRMPKGTTNISRNNESIKALNMDLRINVRFDAPHQQHVRLMLVQFSVNDDVDIAEVLQTTAQGSTDPTRVINSFLKRRPEIKYKVLKDVKVSSSPPNGNATVSRDKFVRMYHKFRDNETQMTYVSDANSEPATNIVYLWGCYAQGRTTAGGNYSNATAPVISFNCRQRFMR